MANTGRRKSPEQRLRGYKAEFRKTSKGGVFHEPGSLPHYAKFFTFDNPKRENVIYRAGFTGAKVLAAIGGKPIYNREPGAHRRVQHIEKKLDRDSEEAERQGNFDPKDVREGRRRVLRAINLRRGQLEFRRKLLEAYGRRCAVTGCDCPDGLEAAHVHPYRGDETNHVQNGILLRSDIHTLFDIGKIGFAPNSYKVIVAKSLKVTVYAKLKGKVLRLPLDPTNRPNEDALRQHLEWCGLISSQAR